MPTPLKQDRDIFDAAIEIGDAAARTAFVERECAGDAEQFARVKALVDAFASAGGFLQTVASDQSAALLDRTRVSIRSKEGPGPVIGNYKLLQELGEGGFGIVYMAEQSRPVKRRVALKIIKPGMDSLEIVARFEAERQALALMVHPNIAQVFDAGTTETGRPFFVMELVKGIPITEFCDKNKLSTIKRLELFLDVCSAVQHAHQKGVIHRDIKPSNILITLHDGKPVPKVIDFGIAKAINQELTGRTLFTAYGSMIGTPAYMSPEQAEMSGLDIDTRSDIYSLGVVLYELLTGETPISRNELKEAGYLEMQKLIREKEPTKPSLAVSVSCRQSTTLSDFRQEEPAQLINAIKGDLDWIVLKALNKDRTRRYETANGFALDVRRYLAHEPVSASPPTAAYLLGKFALRHRRLIAAMASVFVASMVGAVGMTILYFKARADRELAEQQSRVAQSATRSAEAASAAEKEQRQQAQTAARQVKQTLARADFDAGRSWLEQGRSRMALAYLARSLRTEPDHAPTAQLLLSILRDRNHDLHPEMILKADAPIRNPEFNAAQDRLRTRSADGVIWVWDAHSLVRLGGVGKENPVKTASFSHSGKELVTLSSNGVICVWSALSPTNRLAEIKSQTGFASLRMAERADDDLVLATRTTDSEIQVWNGRTGKAITGPLRSPGDFEQDSLILCSGGALVGGRFSGTWRFWDTADASSSPREFVRPDSLGFRIVSSRHSILIQTTRSPNELAGFDLATGRKLFSESLEDFDFEDPVLMADQTRLVCFARSRLLPSGTRTQRFPGVVTLIVDLPAGRVKSWVTDARVSELPLIDGQCRYSLVRGFGESVRLRDLESSEVIREWTPSQPFDTGTENPPMIFSASGERFVLNLVDRIEVYDSQTGKFLSQISKPLKESVRVTLSPSGRRVATSTKAGVLRIWDSETGELLAGPLKHSTFVGRMVFDSAEDRVFAGDYYGTTGGMAFGTVRVWDIRPTRAWHDVEGLPTTVGQATFSLDGRWIAAALGTNGVAVIERQSRKVMATLTIPNGDCQFVAIAPDGQRMAAVSTNGLHLWKVDDSLRTSPFAVTEDTSGLQLVRFSSDGKLLGTLSKDNTARIWDATTGVSLSPPLPHGERVFDLAFRPGRPEMMVMTRGVISIWTLTPPPELPHLTTLDKGRSRWTAHYGLDGSRVLTTGILDAQLWDSDSGRLLDTIPHQSSVRGSVFSPDQKRILTAIPNTMLQSPVPGTAILWDLASKKPVVELPHDDQVGEMAFSPDGRTIVTTCLDGTLRMWDSETAAPLSVKFSHTRLDQHAMEISPDGRDVISIGPGTLSIYPMPFATNAPEWLADLAESVARQRLNSSGALEPVETLREMRTRLSALSDQDDFSRFGKWFMSDPAVRGRAPALVPRR